MPRRMREKEVYLTKTSLVVDHIHASLFDGSEVKLARGGAREPIGSRYLVAQHHHLFDEAQ